MAERTPCLRRCSTIRATSPNHEGVEGTDRDVVWMLTDASAILFMCASLMEVVLFFLLKEAHFYPCSLQVTSRCASRGHYEEEDYYSDLRSGKLPRVSLFITAAL